MNNCSCSQGHDIQENTACEVLNVVLVTISVILAVFAVLFSVYTIKRSEVYKRFQCLGNDDYTEMIRMDDSPNSITSVVNSEESQELPFSELSPDHIYQTVEYDTCRPRCVNKILSIPGFNKSEGRKNLLLKLSIELLTPSERLPNIKVADFSPEDGTFSSHRLVLRFSEESTSNTSNAASKQSALRLSQSVSDTDVYEKPTCHIPPPQSSGRQKGLNIS